MIRPKYSPSSLAVLTWTFLGCLGWTSAQEVGVDVCACQPSAWNFTIDLSLPCPETDPFPNATAQGCLARINDTFVSVSSINIVELDRDLNVQGQSVLSGPFQTGDTVLFNTITASQQMANTTNVGPFNASTLPSALSFSFTGQNASGETIFATTSVVFSANCTAYPAVVEGTETILMRVNSVEDPPESLCPLSSSSSPSENPIGSTVCACQPTEWDFTLDFTNPCPPGNNGNTNNTNNSNNLDDFDSIVVGLPHLHECFPPVLQEGVVDDVNFDETLGIDAIYVLELNSTLQTIEQTTIPGGPFFNGDTFSYQSLLNNINASLFTVDTLPAGLVLIFAGNNSLGQRITASWSVQFSTSCDPYAPDSPVVPPPPQETETLLTRINYSGGPPNAFCPLTNAATAMPSTSPSLAPTNTPSSAPSSTPVRLPTSPPSLVPTSTAPTNAPSTSQPSPLVTDFVPSSCACQPMAWEWELCLFNCACPVPPDYAFGPQGVAQESCIVGGRSTDRTMIMVDSILVMELAQNLTSLTQYMVPNGPFYNGDMITYESQQLKMMMSEQEPNGPTTANTNEINPALVPGGIVVVMSGPNANGDRVDLSWSIEFTNECNVFPVVVGNEETGGTIVRGVQDPPQSLCPAAPGTPPTSQPTLSRTMSPTVSPTLSPTMSPTTEPALSPTNAPTQAPVTPSIRPVAPSPRPTPLPTFGPKPSRLPTLSPTTAPLTPKPTLAPTTTPLTPKPTPYPTATPVTSKPTPYSTRKPTFKYVMKSDSRCKPMYQYSKGKRTRQKHDKSSMWTKKGKKEGDYDYGYVRKLRAKWTDPNGKMKKAGKKATHPTRAPVLCPEDMYYYKGSSSRGKGGKK